MFDAAREATSVDLIATISVVNGPVSTMFIMVES